MSNVKAAYLTHVPGMGATFNYFTADEYIQIPITRDQLINMLVDGATALRGLIQPEDAHP